MPGAASDGITESTAKDPPKVVKPVVTTAAGAAFVPTDPKYPDMKKTIEAKPWNKWGDTEYRMTNMRYFVNGALVSRYFGEETKNISGKTMKFTYTFTSDYKIVSHKSNVVEVTLKNGESVLCVAKYVDKNHDFSWDLYSLKKTAV